MTPLAVVERAIEKAINYYFEDGEIDAGYKAYGTLLELLAEYQLTVQSGGTVDEHRKRILYEMINWKDWKTPITKLDGLHDGRVLMFVCEERDEGGVSTADEWRLYRKLRRQYP